MARSFNVEVFNKTIGGDATNAPQYRTGQEFYAMLGAADALRVQVIVEAVNAINTTVTVSAETTSAQEEETWKDTGVSALTVMVTSPAKTNQDVLRLVAGQHYGAFVRFVVSSNVPTATVRLIATGWSQG